MPPIVEGAGGDHGEAAPGAQERPERSAEAPQPDGGVARGAVSSESGRQNHVAASKGRQSRRTGRSGCEGRRPERIAADAFVPGDVPDTADAARRDRDRTRPDVPGNAGCGGRRELSPGGDLCGLLCHRFRMRRTRFPVRVYGRDGIRAPCMGRNAKSIMSRMLIRYSAEWGAECEHLLSSCSGYVPLPRSGNTIPRNRRILFWIAGLAIDTCGYQVPNVLVTLTLFGLTDVLATTHTYSDGTFIFAAVAPGKYDLHLEWGCASYGPVVAEADASNGADVTLVVRVDGPFFYVEGSPPIPYEHSPLPQALDDPETSATICEVANNPDRFNGEMVTVRGRVRIDFEEFELPTSHCDHPRMDHILLEYGDALERRGKPGFQTIPSLRNSNAGRMPGGSGCHLYQVTATFIGRLDGVPTTLCPDGTTQCPRGSGFGHLGLSSGRLVIRSVSDVVATPIGGSKQR